jgi:YidC/Oxa1 family membrane protein insertase
VKVRLAAASEQQGCEMSDRPKQPSPFRAMLVPMIFFVAWMWIAPKIFPGLQQQPKPPANPNAVLDKEAPKVVEDAAIEAAEIKTFPPKTWSLGSEKPGEGYFQKITLTSKGAAIEAAELNDPSFTTLDRKGPLKIVGNNLAGADETTARTGAINLDRIDAFLSKDKKTLRDVDWELVEAESSAEKAVFSYPSPDGSVVVRKEYRLHKGDEKLRAYDPEGYLLDVTLTFENTGEKPLQVRYDLQGPAGLPLENVENTRFYIEERVGTIPNIKTPNTVVPASLSAANVVKQYDAANADNNPAKVDTWRDPLRYAGVDCQYFTALMLFSNQHSDADGDGRAESYFAEVRPTILYRDDKNKDRSDVSLLLKSNSVQLDAKGKVTHAFQIFFGPKRKELLQPLKADGALSFGWTSPIAMVMLKIMDVFHNVFHAPYALAIVLLTCVVRGLMFPISRGQARSAAIMKELSPKISELKKKYEKEPQKFIAAQQELFRKYNYNMFGGCLPLLLQLPIFMGLYDALQYSVDLRLAKFFWVDNLAAPDALFHLPFRVPWLGWTEFNILPFVTLALFIVQQKMFMPPPTTDEQALQYKMMNFMMVFMGVMFYRVPAGLCLYFIASSLWGIAERKMLSGVKLPTPEELERRAAEQAKIPRKAGMFEKFIAMADAARNQANTQQKLKDSRNDNDRR